MKTLTKHFPDVHEPAHEARVTEEQLKHLVGTDVEHLVYIKPTLHFRQAHSLVHW